MISLRHAATAALAALALVAPATASAQTQPYDDTAYFATADKLQQRLDGLWNEERGYYQGGGGGVEPMVNSLMLLGHSVAAMKGHAGPSRNDERARSLALELVKGPYVTSPAEGQKHAPGWTNSMNGRGFQHLVFDAEVVDGLVYAYRARKELQLPDSTVNAIRDAISRTARGPFWRWPALRLNQFNWNATMLAADATVNGRDDPFAFRALARHIARVRRPRADPRGQGLRFNYVPGRWPDADPLVNFD